jgi:hypothetical protein
MPLKTDPGAFRLVEKTASRVAPDPGGARKFPGRRMRVHAARVGWRVAVLAAALLAVSDAMATEVTGVYVARGDASAGTLHLRSAHGVVVGRFESKDRSYLLEGWLDEPGYMGTLSDQASDDDLLFFVAAKVPGGIRFSVYVASEGGEMDLERPRDRYELALVPGASPDVPPEELAALEVNDTEDGNADISGGEGVIPGAGAPGALDDDGRGATGDSPAAALGAGPFHGPFHGDDGRGGLTMLRVFQQGGQLRGELMAFGELAGLEGTVKGNEAEGRITAAGVTGTFKASLTGNRLALTLVVRGEAGESSVPLQFSRGESKQMSERDPRLIGTWFKSSSYTSGDFSVASSQRCVIQPDGTLTLYGSRMAGGGNAGSFDSGSADEGVTSRWHTQANALFVNGQRYARFGFNGNTLGLWFSEDGKPEIWSRQ